MNIIITGASRGIGYDTVLALAKNQAHQIYVLSRNAQALNQLVEQAKIQNGFTNVVAVPFDLTTEDMSTVKKLAAELGQVDILLNNAGVLVNKAFMDLEMADWRSMFEVNLFGIVRLIKALHPALAASSKAHIVNISSMGGVQGSSKFPGLSAYSASKAAVANLTECLAEELQADSIFCNCLALGAVQTEMLAAAFPGYKAPIQSAEMAAYVADFCLNAHQFMNGKIIPVSISTP